MLGKTHVIGTLALGHIGLLAYLSYKNVDIAEPSSQVPYAEPLELFGFAVTSPLGIVSYTLLAVMITLFVLILLRIGSGKVRIGYLIGMIVLGIAAYFLGDTTYGFGLIVVFLLFTLGSLFPDIDTPTSTIGRYFPFVGQVIGHRTVTHTIWAVLLLGIAVWYFDSVYLFAFTLGYALHIIEDSFSRQGIAWFYPIAGGYDTFGSGATMKKGRKPGVFAYATGGTGETVFFYACIGLNVISFVFVYWSYFT